MAVTFQDNPLRVGLKRAQRPEPCTIVLFGGSGDLARRKLMPSLYELCARDRLPDKFAIVGFARGKRTDQEFRQHVREAVDEFAGQVDNRVWADFSTKLHYIDADFDKAEGYQELRQTLDNLADQLGTGNAMFYLASPPEHFALIIENLCGSNLAKKQSGWRRIVIEKPFGRDLQSARDLNRLAARGFDEQDIFRVDHYLGKDTVQNILVFRFSNSIFEPVWNRRYIDQVQITLAETVGMESRGAFYDETGALRDIIQNHMLQLIALTAMEPPVEFEADCIRDEKMKVSRSIRKFALAEVDANVVRGQYSAGVIDDEEVAAYRQEEDVSPDSVTETYVAARIFIDNWRWQDVPFYVRTGKRLARKKTEVAVQFKPVPHGFFGPTRASRLSPNTLVMRIQPDEGISLKIETKPPGPTFTPRSVDLDFRYLQAFGVTPGEAYERIFMDVMIGDQTLFARQDTVESQWEIMTPILQAWESSTTPGFPNYEAGSWGPREADDLLERDGRRWRRL